jgi:hypothetical protein
MNHGFTAPIRHSNPSWFLRQLNDSSSDSPDSTVHNPPQNPTPLSNEKHSYLIIIPCRTHFPQDFPGSFQHLFRIYHSFLNIPSISSTFQSQPQYCPRTPICDKLQLEYCARKTVHQRYHTSSLYYILLVTISTDVFPLSNSHNFLLKSVASGHQGTFIYSNWPLDFCRVLPPVRKVLWVVTAKHSIRLLNTVRLTIPWPGYFRDLPHQAISQFSLCLQVSRERYG